VSAGDLSDLIKPGRLLLVALPLWLWPHPVMLLLLACWNPMSILHDCKATASSLGLNVAEATPFCACGLSSPWKIRLCTAVSHSFLSLPTGVKSNFKISACMSALSLVMTVMFGKSCHCYQTPGLTHTLCIWANSTSQNKW